MLRSILGERTCYPSTKTSQHTHARTHTRTHARTHARTHVHTHMCTHTHARMHAHTRTHPAGSKFDQKPLHTEATRCVHDLKLSPRLSKQGA